MLRFMRKLIRISASDKLASATILSQNNPINHVLGSFIFEWYLWFQNILILDSLIESFGIISRFDFFESISKTFHSS